MSDNFIPLNQSTPVQNRWQQNNSQNSRYKSRGGGNRGARKSWNNSRNSSGTNSSNTSYTGNNSSQQERYNIDDYIHPSMLQDPWAELRRDKPQNKSN